MYNILVFLNRRIYPTFTENDYNRTMITRLLDAGVDINARTDWGDTAAHYAALHGTYEALALLFEEGISVNKPKECE
jgi:ankyrin repeat protein